MMKKGWSNFMDRRVKERLVGATILVVLVVLIVPELLSGPKQSAPSAPAVALPAASAPAPALHSYEVNLATSATRAEDTSGASAAPSPREPESGAGGTAAPAPGTAAPSSATPVTATPAPATPAPAAPTPAPGVERNDTATQHMSSRPAPPTVTTLHAQQPAAPVVENGGPPPKSGTGGQTNGATHDAVRAATPEAPHHGWVVQLGSFAKREYAEKLQRSLKGKGHQAFVSAAGAGKALRYRVRVGPLSDRAAADREIVRLKKEGHAGSVVAP
jgi:DedD protein